MADSNTQAAPGWIGLTVPNTPFNHSEFHQKQMQSRMRTAMPVKIIAVHGGGVGAPPTVDVQPLVNMVDGLGNQMPHATIYNIPCHRPQAGDSTIINDPNPGDIGMMLIADRDISTLKANNGAQSGPGSNRMHSPADGIYIGQILNQGTPKQYIQFNRDGDGNGTGLKIVDNVGNTIETSSSGVNINGLIIDSHGNLTTPGGVQAGTGNGDSVTLQHHVHPGTGAPTPGT